MDLRLWIGEGRGSAGMFEGFEPDGLATNGSTLPNPQSTQSLIPKQMAQDYDSLIQAGALAHAEGRLDEAERIARELLAGRPDDVQALLLMGIVGVKKNDPRMAVPSLQRVLEKDPESFDAAYWFSIIMRKHGRHADALAMAQRAVAQNVDSEHAQNQLGMCLLDMNQREEAVACFRRACELGPNVAPFFDNLGRALQALGKASEAILAYRQVLAIGPVRPAALYKLGDAYMSVPDPGPAAECAQAILRLDPNSVSGNLLLARALIGDGQVAQGAKYAKRTMELAPGNAVPVAYYGRALQSLGKIAEADEQFRRSIELEPRQGFAYHSLVHNHKVTEDERPVIAKMEALAREGDLPKRELIQLEYGLGKALEDLGEYEAAMSHFDEANRIDHTLKIGTVPPFQPKQLEETASFLIRTFTPNFFEQFRVAGSDSELPIFVVGMMRSGTTLAEQILSSHPDVGGAGEQLFWPENAGSSERLFNVGERAQFSFGVGEQSKHKVPDGAATAKPLSPAREVGERSEPGERDSSRNWKSPLSGDSFDFPKLQALASEYLALLQKIAPHKPRVVDKMNTNYLLLGLLNLAFPNARMIHMRRNPLDTCISIWATPVANGIDLCASKQNIVIAYQQYLRVMEHWRQVLPPDRFLDVQYEELVGDRERVTRQMIDFCGLAWDDACMSPEQNTRSVRTPSVWQVRQPVYKTSMERWRKYEPWLGAFAELMSETDGG